jgi:hypothetical protein
MAEIQSFTLDLENKGLLISRPGDRKAMRKMHKEDPKGMGPRDEAQVGREARGLV